MPQWPAATLLFHGSAGAGAGDAMGEEPGVQFMRRVFGTVNNIYSIIRMEEILRRRGRFSLIVSTYSSSILYQTVTVCYGSLFAARVSSSDE